MEIIHFAGGHFDLISTVAIIASLLFTAVEFRHSAKAQRVTNLLTLTRHHREIWSQFYARPGLHRVLNPKADLKRKPVTNEEALFVTFLILHLQAYYQATREKMFIKSKAVDKDIHWIFSLPIPKSVWEKSKATQDEDFVAFVEGAFN